MTRLYIPPEVTWELLVVNNRCTDDTDAVIDSFAASLPIRRLWEPEPGLSNARNRVLEEATGDYIVWTDDDVFVDAGWIDAYVRAFLRWPDAAVFGGPIEPLFEGDPPSWLRLVLQRIGGVYGLQTLGREAVKLHPERVGEGPYGGNMAMRRSVLLQFPFDRDLGVRHGDYAIGEETEAIRRILEAGHTGWWSPEPQVQHWVPRSSQTVAYVRRWMVGAGRFKARTAATKSAASWRARLGMRAYVARHEVQFQIRRHLAPPEVWIMDLVRASHARGMLEGYGRE